MTKEERKEYDRKYRLENIEKIKAHSRKYKEKIEKKFLSTIKSII